MGTELEAVLLPGLFWLGACAVALWPLNYLIGLPQWAVWSLTLLVLLLLAPLFLLWVVLPGAALLGAVWLLWIRPQEIENAARHAAELDAEYAAKAEADRKREARRAAEEGHRRKRAKRAAERERRSAGRSPSQR